MRVPASLALAAAAIVIWAALQGGSAQQAQSARENAYRANNVGVARLEQADFASATAAFRRALEIDPSTATAHAASSKQCATRRRTARTFTTCSG
jgi:Tfp pilus assembly protein PilF